MDTYRSGTVVTMVGWLAPVVVVAVLVAVIPTRCHHPIAKPPYRGCRRLGLLLLPCRYHGLHPGYRVIALLGGTNLAHRRVCYRCGARTVYGRHSKTGEPFIGCSTFPDCRTPRYLSRYRF